MEASSGQRAWVLGFGLVAVTLGATQVPQPPDSYYALDPLVGGEIVGLADANGSLRLRNASGLGGVGGSFPGLGQVESEPWVELRYAKGWMYFDDPGSDGQLRFNLRDGRRRLRVGHLVEIGRFPEMGGGRESGGARVRLEGWILVRVSPGPNLQPDGDVPD